MKQTKTKNPAVKTGTKKPAAVKPATAPRSAKKKHSEKINKLLREAKSVALTKQRIAIDAGKGADGKRKVTYVNQTPENIAAVQRAIDRRGTRMQFDLEKPKSSATKK